MENTEPKTNALYAHIENLLKKIPELVTDEKELRYNKIKEMAENGEVTLLSSLMKDEKIKAAFFVPVLDSFVFKARAFKEFLDYSSSNNSYSQYLGKKIGLYVGDSALTDRSEVVLNFPYKDCVLEGGQRKEDGLDTYFSYDAKAGDYLEKTDKRREVFFNETLAKDEIDSLFSPKAFCNVKKFTKDGEEEFFHLERDAEKNRNRGLADDTITDNLIIKGNNLLALHSLKKQFEGKVKLIYIDPPYNTGSDDFKYNDNFNHSSWLTFMKNRLEIARELLREDGCIFVQCDDNEQAYLKVLMDEIFGRENYINSICVKMSTTSGVKTAHREKRLIKEKEFLLFYSKTNNISIIPQYIVSNEWDNEFQYFLDKNNSTKPSDWKVKKLKDILYENKLNQEITDKKTYEFINNNADKIWRRAFIRNEFKSLSQENPDEIFVSNDGEHYYYRGREMYFLKDKTHRCFSENGYTNSPSMLVGDIWNDINTGKLFSEEAKEFRNGKKPEFLIARIIDMITQDYDIVLDYHLGSGTTAAVAHKMNRQYIGVEQMDYIRTISCERMKNVLTGEQGGISKSVNWQGGGSFVYMELAEKNEKAMKIISACKSYDELIFVFENLAAKYFLHYNVRVNEFINKVCKENEFKNLPLKKQKEIFMRMLDLNQLYVNCDDRYDKDSGLSENDIMATEDFYQISKDGQ